jgi:hypothetical protein
MRKLIGGKRNHDEIFSPQPHVSFLSLNLLFLLLNKYFRTRFLNFLEEVKLECVFRIFFQICTKKQVPKFLCNDRLGKIGGRKETRGGIFNSIA